MTFLGKTVPAFACLLLLAACSVSKHHYSPRQKIPADKLRKDYQVFRNVLEEGHPSLYWYTPKDSLDYFFESSYARITDSMTEPQFRTLLSYVISKINCGHTTIRYSNGYYRYLDTADVRQFPLSIKLWDDSAAVYLNLNHRDTLLKRGTLIKSIDGRDVSFYRDSLFQFLSMDGRGISHKFQTLSNRGVFGGWYRNVFGLKDRFRIGYLSQTGEEGTTEIPVYDPAKDSLSRWMYLQYLKRSTRKERKREALLDTRNLILDTAAGAAYLTLNSFTRTHSMARFLRRTFRTIRRHEIKHLAIDVRNNGGGNVGVSTLLTRYIIDRPFKLADSLYAINKKSRYRKYIQHYWLNRLSMNIVTKKRSDGKYHFGYFERHYFKPKRNNHFNGDVYVIIGGNSFSATTLFADAVKGQKNVLLVGEETGGGAYGNTAWMIPDVTLPHSRLRFRLPKFRMVVSKDFEKTGHGVQPDIHVSHTLQTIRDGIDPKIEKVKELIRGRKAIVQQTALPE